MRYHLRHSELMSTLLRRLRGLIGVGLSWAVIWGAIGGAALPLLSGMNDAIAPEH